MTIQHSLLTGANLHEPKGVASATVNKVYVSDGAGSGTWKIIEPQGAATALVNKVYQADGAGSGTWQYPMGKIYGELYITSGATSFTLATASAYSRLDPGTVWTQGLVKNVTTTAADGTMTLANAGTYRVDFWANFSTAALAAGTAYNFKLALDGTPTGRKIHVHKTDPGAETLFVSGSALLTVTASQVLSIHIAGDATSSATAITVDEANMIAIRLTE